MLWIWIGFLVFIFALLALDLGVFHRRAHVVSIREAMIWSAVWVVISLLFGIFVYLGYQHHWLGLGTAPDAIGGEVNNGANALVKYLTGYIVEKSLSMDNIFVMAMLFAFFAVPAIYQHRVLFWGILGALVLRGAMIALGAQLISRYKWILYVFGAFLIVTALKMLFSRSEKEDPGRNIVLRLIRRWLPITHEYHGKHFFVRHGPDARWALTPLAVALVLIEATDVVFAVDSIPAIFGVTADPFLVFTSNVFAILGLRSLYFALAGMMDKFRCL